MNNNYREEYENWCKINPSAANHTEYHEWLELMIEKARNEAFERFLYNKTTLLADKDDFVYLSNPAAENLTFKDVIESLVHTLASAGIKQSGDKSINLQWRVLSQKDDWKTMYFEFAIQLKIKPELEKDKTSTQ